MSEIKRTMRLAHVTTCLAILSTGIPYAAAAQESPTEMLAKLYSYVSGQFMVGETLQSTGRNFLVLSNPGILIDPDLNFSNPEDQYILANTIDQILVPSAMYSTTSANLSKLYQQILTYHAHPKVELTENQKKEFNAAKKYVLNNTGDDFSDKYKKYQEYALVLSIAQEDLENWIYANPTGNPPPTKVVAYEQAKQQYNLLGDATEAIKQEYNYRRYQMLDPAATWGLLDQQFSRGSLDYLGQRYGRYAFYPKYTKWFSADPKWTKTTLYKKDLEETKDNGHSSVGGSGGWSALGFGVSAGGSTSEEWKNSDLEVSEFSVTGEYMRVIIMRPWMDATMLTSDAWTWQDNAAINSQPLSDGVDPFSGVAPKGQSPFVPVALLLAKNVVISGKWNKDISEYTKTVSGGNAGFRWGPFRLGGKKASQREKTYTVAKATTAGLEMVSPQILGFFVNALPHAPNPNPAYKWDEDALLPSDNTGGTDLAGGFSTGVVTGIAALKSLQMLSTGLGDTEVQGVLDRAIGVPGPIVPDVLGARIQRLDRALEARR